jgi:polar amino acid transport system substrate-binding protein
MHFILKLTLFATLGTTLVNTVKACEMKIGWETWPIYQEKTASGKMIGLDIEITEAIAEEAGCKIRYIELPWVRQLKDNETGKIDVVMAASRNPEREVYATFTEGFHEETNSLFVRLGIAANIKSIPELGKSNLKIAYEKGAYLGEEIEAIKNKLDSTGESVLINIKNTMMGRLDGFIVDQFAGIKLIKALKAENEIMEHPLAITTGEVYLMVSKKTKVHNLRNKLSKAYKKLKARGVIGKIIAKYK